MLRIFTPLNSNVIHYGKSVLYKETVEILSILSALNCVNAFMPELSGVVYATTTVVIVSAVFYLISLFVSFPISSNFKQALAYSIGSMAIWFGAWLFLFSIGYGMEDKLELFSLFMLFLLVSS